jgi:hypothetical protein
MMRAPDWSAHVPSTPPRPGLLATLANVLMCGLAAGAVWCLLSLPVELDTGLLIVPFAIAIAAYLRWQGHRGRGGAWCALAATLIAFAYAQYLFAAVRIASLLGFPLRDTLFKTDLGLAWPIIRAHLRLVDLAALGVACAGAVWMMLRSRE